MTRELSQNNRRLAALGAIGLLWGAFLVALGISVPFVAIVVGGVLLGAAGVVHRRRLAQRWLIGDSRVRGIVDQPSRLLGAVRAASARVGRIDWRATGAALDSRVRALRPKPGRRDALRLNEQAAALRNRGRAVDSFEPIERALAIFRRLGDRRGEALTLNGLGLTQARVGDEAGALDSYETAVTLLTELGDSQGAGRVLANLGALHRGRGHDERARAAWNDALERLEPGTPEHDRTAQQLRLAS